MWARHLELTLALWLGASPFVLRYPAVPRAPWWQDLGLASLIAFLALACHARRLRRAHLAQLLVATWLVGRGWWSAYSGEATPASQNHLVVGLLLGMFAVVPSLASAPPRGWSGSGESDQSSSST